MIISLFCNADSYYPIVIKTEFIFYNINKLTWS